MRLVRSIDTVEAEMSVCCWQICDIAPTYRVATPIGDQDFCDSHVDLAVASLPEHWVAGWRHATNEISF